MRTLVSGLLIGLTALFFAGAASAVPVITMTWTATTGTGTAGGNSIDAAIGERQSESDVGTFSASFLSAGVPETDSDCLSPVGGTDFATFSMNFLGAPGPSGLGCANLTGAPCP